MPHKKNTSAPANGIYHAIAKAFTLAACAAVTVSTLNGCAEIRKVTYPPEFKYVDRSEVRSAMGLFAASLWDINDLLIRKNVSEDDHLRVISLLTIMEKKADELDPKGNPTNHPLIDKHLESFRSELWDARVAMTDEPPNYYLAGQLYGKCLACHEERDIYKK